MLGAVSLTLLCRGLCVALTGRRRNTNRVGAAMDPLNLQVMVNANGTSGDRLRQALESIRASRYKDRMVVFTQISVRDLAPGGGARIAQQLEADVKAGALGLGEIMKDFGMRARKSDGSRLKIDDSELDWLIIVTLMPRRASARKTRAATPGTPAMPRPSTDTRA